MSAYTVLDVLADPQMLVGAHVRRKIAETIFEIVEGDGVVSAATLRPALIEAGVSRDLMDKRMPAMLGTAARQGALEWTGQYTVSGNSASRNDQRAVKVYRAASMLRLLDWVASYQDAYRRDRQRLAEVTA